MAGVKRFLSALLKTLAAGLRSVIRPISRALIGLWPRYAYLPAASQSFPVLRLPDNPSIDTDMSPWLAAVSRQQVGINSNAAARVRVPAWIDNPQCNNLSQVMLLLPVSNHFRGSDKLSRA